MHHPQYDDHLDAQIRSADPLALQPVGSVDQALTQVFHALPREPNAGRSSIWRRARPRTVVVATIALAAAGSVAAAGILSARTGTTVPDNEVSMAGPGENLRMDAPDFNAVVTQIAADIPFAPGSTLKASMAWASVQKRDNEPALVSTGAVRGYVARSAGCSWVDYWATGDAAARAEATRNVETLLASRAVLDVDPKPSVTGDLNDDGLRGPTIFGPLAQYVQTMRSGDAALLKTQVSTAMWCMPGDMFRSGWTK